MNQSAEVDRTARDKVTKLLGEFLAGKIDGTSLNADWPAKTTDNAISQIEADLANATADSDCGENPSDYSPELKGKYSRAILFLRTDESWESHPTQKMGAGCSIMAVAVFGSFAAVIVFIGMSFFMQADWLNRARNISLGFFIVSFIIGRIMQSSEEKKYTSRKKAFGDPDAWPFTSIGQLKDAEEKFKAE